jgi:PAS domain S-box-containing protein
MSSFAKATGVMAASVLLTIGIWAAAKYDIVGSLLSTNYLPHAHCYLLESGLIWTNAISDGLIWLSYVGIAVGLVALLLKTRDLLLFRWVFVAFGLFIVACGFTHLFEVVTLWEPAYWLSTSVKLLTAGASVVTAIAFAPLVPRAAEAIRLYHEKYSKSEKQRVETLSKLLDTEERMRLAIESAGLGTWERNLLTKEVVCDARCRKLFGIPDHKQLTYQDFLRLVHPEDRARVEALTTAALARHHEYNGAYRVLTDTGETRHVIARGKAFHDEEGQAVRLVGTVMDVTKERQAEEVLVRTEKLAAAGRMAASIAHEINNPLNAAIGILYLARTNKDVPQEVNQQLQAIEREINRAALITRSTLTFYRESPNPVPTNPVELVEGVLAFQQVNIGKAGVQVSTDLVYSGPIYAFPGELRQILTNLISNAIEVLPEKGRLVVRVHPARDWRTGRDGYRIMVADNGSGIPPETRTKLFAPFYTTKGEKGTGLGLWITSQLVEKNGGAIKFRSRYDSPDRNGGTVFSVWLPLAHDITCPVGD